MPKYNVYFMSPMMEWEDIEADNEAQAIERCGTPDVDPADGPYSWIAEEQED